MEPCLKSARFGLGIAGPLEVDAGDEWALFVEDVHTHCSNEAAIDAESCKDKKGLALAALDFFKVRGLPIAGVGTPVEAWVPFVLKELNQCLEALQTLTGEIVERAHATKVLETLSRASERAVGLTRSRVESRPWRDPFEVHCLVLGHAAAWAAHATKSEHAIAIQCIDSAIIFEGASASLLSLVGITEPSLPLGPPLPDVFPDQFDGQVSASSSSSNVPLPRFNIVEGTDLVASTNERSRCSADVRSAFLDGKEAMVLEGAVTGWPALEKWRRLDFWVPWLSRLIPIEVSPEEGGQRALTIGDFLAEYIAPSIRNSPGARLGYLAQHLLFDHIPKLRKDFDIPNFCPTVTQANAWIGTSSTVTRLHTDGYDNCFVQVCGFKFVILVPPSDNHLVYPYDDCATSVKCNHSHVDAESPDLKLHPLYALASQRVVVLGPGDCLFIPKGWWHYVRGLTPSISISLTW